MIVGTVGGEAAAAPVAQKAAQAARQARVELTELILTVTGSQLEYGTLVQVPAHQTQVGFCCRLFNDCIASFSGTYSAEYTQVLKSETRVLHPGSLVVY